MSLPISQPAKLIERQALRGLWPTSMTFREEGGVLVGTVEAWGPKHRPVALEEEPHSRRGIVQHAMDF